MKLLSRQANNSLDGADAWINTPFPSLLHLLPVPVLTILTRKASSQSLTLPEKTAVDIARRILSILPFRKSHPYALGFASTLTFVTSDTCVRTPNTHCGDCDHVNLSPSRAWHSGCALNPTRSPLSLGGYAHSPKKPSPFPLPPHCAVGKHLPTVDVTPAAPACQFLGRTAWHLLYQASYF